LSYQELGRAFGFEIFFGEEKMKKFLIAGSSLAAVAAAGSAGAVDVTLGGSISMGVEYGVGKAAGEIGLGDAYNTVSLSISAAGTTDGGLKYGGSFGLGTAAELSFTPYKSTDSDGEVDKYAIKATNGSHTDIEAAVYNVSGGAAVDAADVVAVKINSEWKSVGGTNTNYEEPLDSFESSNLCKIAGQGVNNATGTRSIAHVSGYMAAQKVTGGAGTVEGIDFVGGSKGTVDVVGDSEDDEDTDPDVSVTSAAIYAGPFMEVMLASSSTKMVVGAVCLEGMAASDTMIYMNNASKVVTAGAASIYIEGGFGKLTLQSGDYSGAVSAIGGAGNAAGIDAEGLVLVANGVGVFGANPYLAMDLADGTAAANIEVAVGGSFDFGGLSAAVDLSLDGGLQSLIGTDVGAWDLGLSYQMGDLALAAATDSENDWGLSASMGIAGFAVNTTFTSEGSGDHEKSGIMYSVGASTSLNGFGLSIGFDQGLQPSVGVSYSLGALGLSAGYSAADNGGKIGATLSF
jgi:hypothetical protein